MKVIILGISFLLVSVLFAQDINWKLAKNKRGVRVYTVKIEGARLKDSKTETTIQATINEVLVKFRDINNHYEWMDRVGESKLLKKTSDTDFYVYYLIKAPWPVSDRDLVAHYTIKQISPGRVYIQVIGKPEFIAENEKLIRIREMNSSWFFTDVGEGKLDVVYKNHADPGGSIPDWLVNSASEDSPFKTMIALKDSLEGI